jgi:hypothetical protein
MVSALYSILLYYLYNLMHMVAPLIGLQTLAADLAKKCQAQLCLA